MSPELATKLRGARGYIFDMDGTLVLGSAAGGGFAPLPGALELLATLRARDIPFVVFTNGTAKHPHAYAASLRQAGFTLDDSQMMTPASSAVDWLLAQNISRVRVLGQEGLIAPLEEAGLRVIAPGDPATGAEAVLTGWHKDFALSQLELAARDIWAGARVTSASHVAFFATAGGRALGHSFVINAAIKALTGKSALVLGKPSRFAMASALRRMGLPPRAARGIVVVGDDPALEMRLARNCGATGIAVTTGVQDRAALQAAPPRAQAHAILDGLNPLLTSLGGTASESP